MLPLLTPSRTTRTWGGTDRNSQVPQETPRKIPGKCEIPAPPKNGIFRPPGNFPRARGGPRGAPPGPPQDPPKWAVLGPLFYILLCAKYMFSPIPPKYPQKPPKMAQKKGPAFVPTGRVIKYPKKCTLSGGFSGISVPRKSLPPGGLPRSTPKPRPRSSVLDDTGQRAEASVINTHLVGTRCSAVSDTSDFVLVSYVVCTVQARWRGGSSRVGQAPRPSRVAISDRLRL